MGQSFTEWRVDQSSGGTANMYFGPAPVWRDELDYKRSGYNQTPEAQYPDGYLGSITNRRGDRLMDALKSRQNERSYQRGVHKGERIDPGDYFFSKSFSVMSGIERQGRFEIVEEPARGLVGPFVVGSVDG